jgi:hypothetical protein
VNSTENKNKKGIILHDMLVSMNRSFYRKQLRNEELKKYKIKKEFTCQNQVVFPHKRVNINSLIIIICGLFEAI